MGTSLRDKAVLDLLQSAGLPPAQVDSMAEQARDIAWWRQRNPRLSIDACSPGDFPESAPLASNEVARQAAQVEREGFFQTGQVLEPSVIGCMRECVEGLLKDRWPPVFAFVYDQFWQVMRTPSLARLVSSVLGEGWKQNALVWTFHVPATRGAGGWAPHSDDALQLSRARITVWIPLSDATVENGCMYVIPRDRMPPGLPSNYGEITGATREELNLLLQAVKALPSPPGALMGWDHQLIHWGSTSTGRTRDRISIAAEFIAAGEKTKAGELPLMGPDQLPTLHERVRIVGSAIVEYGRVELLMRKYAALGARLRDSA